MTPADHDPRLDDEPLDDDTLAVHAVVDDEATPEQRRRVARDPALVAQVAALRATVAAVAEPVTPPSADVLAAIRSRALDAALAGDEAAPTEPEAAEPYAAPPAAPPVRDLAAARTRRARRLPPLPAVAAVVILLVLVGVSLLVAGGGSQDDQADGGDSALTAEADGDGASGGGSGDAAESSDDGNGPSGELREELLADAIARYDDDAALLDELRRVDPDTLALSGADATVPEDSPPTTAAPSSTTTSLPGTEGEGSETTTTADVDIDGRAAAAFAASSEVQRCDSVLRSAEPDLGPVVAAVLVDVDGIPVLVLSNPVEATDEAPAGIRLTVLNAIDCSPRAAVVR